METAIAPNHDGTMKAIVQDRYGPPEVLQLRQINKPVVADGRVLVRVRAASVNALDWHLTRGEPYLVRMSEGLRKPKIAVRGADVAGIVEGVGKNVTRLKPGDEVFGQGRGTFAEFTSSREGSLLSKPRNLTFEQAAAVPAAGYTALQGLRDKAQVQPGQRVLINGAGGGVGTFAVQIAKALGAHVTAVTRTRNVDLVGSIGADEVVDYTKEDFTRREQRYDVFFDIGGNRSLGDSRRLLSPNGTLVLVGAPGGRWLSPIPRWLKASVLSRFGSQRFVPFLAQPRHQDLVHLKELIEAGRLSPVIDRQYALSKVPDAVRYVEEGQARGKVGINVS